MDACETILLFWMERPIFLTAFAVSFKEDHFEIGESPCLTDAFLSTKKPLEIQALLHSNWGTPQINKSWPRIYTCLGIRFMEEIHQFWFSRRISGCHQQYQTHRRDISNSVLVTHHSIESNLQEGDPSMQAGPNWGDRSFHQKNDPNKPLFVKGISLPQIGWWFHGVCRGMFFGCKEFIGCFLPRYIYDCTFCHL